MKIIVRFRDDTVRVYEHAKLIDSGNDKITVIKYNGIEKTDYIPIINYKWLTTESE